MSIFVRIWLAFSVILIAGSAMTIKTLQQQVKPSVRQVVEDTLSDNANLLANLLAADVVSGYVQTPEFKLKVQRLIASSAAVKPTPTALGSISGVKKSLAIQHLYITNAKGIVLYDSQGIATGRDYSQWNDVYLTLRGQYGARSTRLDPNDDTTSVMYVAAPIKQGDQMLGVLTLVKPSQTVQPYIDNSRKQMLTQGIGIIILSVFLSALVAWWIRSGIYKVRQQALAVNDANKQTAPQTFVFAKELTELSQAICDMRYQLENRAYVENYVHTLTHELKSPLTAIFACAQLLEEPLQEVDRLAFSANIQRQTIKLQQLVDRLLLLTKLENSAEQLKPQKITLLPLLSQCIEAVEAQRQQQQITINHTVDTQLYVFADGFWLKQLLSNIIDNALQHTPNGASITITAQVERSKPHAEVIIVVSNDGAPIPDYALDKVFDRYFSIASSVSSSKKHKGTGIGLTLVHEIMAQHGGRVSIANVPNGVEVRCVFKGC